MLKLYFFVLCLTALSLAQDKITGRYENLNLDMILSNNRILDSYIKCLLDKGPCTAEGRELKGECIGVDIFYCLNACAADDGLGWPRSGTGCLADIPKAIVTGCTQCTDKQKTLVRKAAGFVMKNRPQDWDAITKRYDPQQKYMKTFTEFLQST